MSARDDHYIRNVERGTTVASLSDLQGLEQASVLCVDSMKEGLFLLSAPATALILLTPLVGCFGTAFLFLAYEDPVVRVCAAICALLSLLAVTKVIYKIFPKVSSLDVVREGLLLQTDEPGAPCSLIPWDALGALDIKTERSAGLKPEKWLHMPLRLRIGGGSTMVVPYRIRWADVIRSVDIGQFLSAVRSFAPHADLSPELRALLLAPETARTNYTELWLHEFSRAPKRLRMETLEPGAQLQNARFEIAGRLGIGGQGVAYLAVDKQTQTDVVLKEYILPVYREEEFQHAARQKLEREAAILRELDHPQIIRLLDFFMEDFRGYLVLEYIEGETLRALVTREGPQPEQYCADLIAQVCNIAFYLHNLSPAIVHRDITPENLILDRDGKLTLVDFNVAQHNSPQTTATIVGKHAYIAPEQFRGKPTTQSDIYSIGCTLHFLLTGQDPEAITRSSPNQVSPRVSARLNDIVERATATTSEMRYQEVKDLLIDLANAPART